MILIFLGIQIQKISKSEDQTLITREIILLFHLWGSGKRREVKSYQIFGKGGGSVCGDRKLTKTERD